MIQSMPNTPVVPASTLVSPEAALTADPRPTVCWGAIFAGLAAALALQVLFMMLGAGLGFAIYSPLTNDNPVADLGTGAVVVQGISAVFSLWFGGWVAGRFAPLNAQRAGWLHGFIVWCSATVAGVLLVSFGAGWVLGDLAKVVGGGLSLAGKPAAAMAESATNSAKDALKQSSDTLASFVDEAVGRVPANGNVAAGVRAKREIGFALTRLFNPTQPGNPAEARAAAVKALVDNTGLSEAEADRTVTGWTTSYENLKRDLAAAKEQAETKAREAADKAAKALAIFSLCAFVGFSLGALAASLGGKHGASHARKHSLEPLVIGS